MARFSTKNVNWKKAEAAYSAGVLTNIEIAKECGVDESTIRLRAKKHGWQRDLTARVRSRANEKLTLAMAGQSEIPNQTPRTPEEDEQTIEQAALTQVAVVREHSSSIRRGLEITTRLMHELDVSTTKGDELMDMILADDDDKRKFAAIRAVSLPGRAAVMRDLAQAARVWINLERQAFRISDERSREMPSAINDMTEEELRASILDDLRILGMDGPKPRAIAGPGPAKAQGVVPKKG